MTIKISKNRLRRRLLRSAQESARLEKLMFQPYVLEHIPSWVRRFDRTGITDLTELERSIAWKIAKEYDTQHVGIGQGPRHRTVCLGCDIDEESESESDWGWSDWDDGRDLPEDHPNCFVTVESYYGKDRY